MSRLETSFAQLQPIIVISFGSVGQRVADLLAADYPIRSGAAADLQSLVAQSKADGSVVPSVVLIADTDHAAEVVTSLEMLRNQSTGLHPRVWSAFVSGTVTDLADFDRALDEADAALVDVVLMLTSAPSVSEQAAALAAWLRVKVPSPGSVLGELPDASGRTCRYVAVGRAAAIAPVVDQSAVQPDVAAATKALNSLVAKAQKEVSDDFAKLPAALALVKSAEDLELAAHEAVPAKIMRADRAFQAALAAARDSVPIDLSEISRATIKAGIGSIVECLSNDESDLEAVLDDVQQSLTSERTEDQNTTEAVELLSELVVAASKGGLAKMFARGKVTDLGSKLSAAVDRQAGSTMASAIALAQSEVPTIAAVELRSAFEVRSAAAELANEKKVAARKSHWENAIANAFAKTRVWPAASTDDFARSWGGGLAEPRRYVVGSHEVVSALIDQTDVLAVVDLREPPDACVLVAQYGLPLAAFTA